MTSLLVLIPCLNEEQSIGAVIDGVPRVLPGVSDIAIAVIDDGSTDATGAIARARGATVLTHGRNRGVGAALRTGLAHARRVKADITVSIDGDGQFDQSQIGTLIEPILRGEADFATASRFKDPALVPHMPKVKIFGNRRIAWLVSSLTGIRMYDVSCGFRAYSRDVVEAIHILGNFTYTHEVIMQVAFRGFRIAEIALPVRGVREFGQSRVASDLWRYARLSSGIILNCFRDHRPFYAFSLISGVFFAIACGFGLFFLQHRIVSGQFEPHIWSGFVSAFFAGLACLTMVLGQVAIMVFHLRETLLQESRHMAAMVEDLQRRHNGNDSQQDVNGSVEAMQPALHAAAKGE